MRDDDTAHERVLELLSQEGGAGEASVSSVAALRSSSPWTGP